MLKFISIKKILKPRISNSVFESRVTKWQ